MPQAQGTSPTFRKETRQKSLRETSSSRPSWAKFVDFLDAPVSKRI